MTGPARGAKEGWDTRKEVRHPRFVRPAAGWLLEKHPGEELTSRRAQKARVAMSGMPRAVTCACMGETGDRSGSNHVARRQVQRWKTV